MSKAHLQVLEELARAPLAKDGTISERRWKVATMRRLAITWDQIAESLGLSEATIRNDYRVFMKELVSETREDMIASQKALTTDLIRANYVSAMAGDIDSQKMILRAMDHDAKVFGLYAPTRVDHGIGEREFAVEAAQLFRDLGMDIPKAIRDTAGIDTLDAEVIVDEFDLPRFTAETSRDVTPAEEPWSNIL